MAESFSDAHKMDPQDYIDACINFLHVPQPILFSELVDESRFSFQEIADKWGRGIHGAEEVAAWSRSEKLPDIGLQKQIVTWLYANVELSSQQEEVA